MTAKKLQTSSVSQTPTSLRGGTSALNSVRPKKQSQDAGKKSSPASAETKSSTAKKAKSNTAAVKTTKTTTDKKAAAISKKKQNVKSSTKKTVQDVAVKSDTKKKPLKTAVSKNGSEAKNNTKTKTKKTAVPSKKTIGNKNILKTPELKSKKKAVKTERFFPSTKWGNDSIISFEATEHMPSPELTSIAGGFIFYEDRLILANIPGRGWEIVGGRIDLGESPEETFRREAFNQAGVELDYVQMIGIVRLDHSGPEPPNCPYPFPIGYGIQYIGIAKELPKFYGNNDSLGRSLVTPEGFREHYYEWNEYYDAVFRHAFEVYQKAKKKLKL